MARDKEKIRKYKKAYYQKNKDKLLKLTKTWRINNLEKRREYKKAYYAKNKEKIRERAKEWRTKNPDKVRKYKKRDRTKNIEKIRERLKEWRLKNIDKIREYRINNKEKLMELEARYRIFLSDNYIKKLLVVGTILNHKDIHPELIEAKRMHIKLLRMAKRQGGIS